MPKAKNAKADEAFDLYKQGLKLIDIANQLDLPAGTIRRWKSSYKWDNERSDKKSERSQRKKGGQPDNKNSVGHAPSVPKQNKNAEKHGLFTKYLPRETLDIVTNMTLNPLDILWDNIQIAYAAIIRAQQIMYVRDIEDKTIEKVEEKYGNVSGESWEVQQAWDKQANFMKAQARAQGELRGLIKQYDEMLHNNWELATEEQKARISVLRARVQEEVTEVADDGFLAALNGSAVEDWADEEDT